jgi:endonuclease/exonuclease/phosphatase family metal-dependent hydrolase
MNAEPDSLAMQFLRGDAAHQDQTGALADAWLAVNGDEPGYTSSSQEPHHRIDYLYASANVEIIACQIILDEPVGELFASDHFGVLCEVLIP